MAKETEAKVPEITSKTEDTIRQKMQDDMEKALSYGKGPLLNAFSLLRKLYNDGAIGMSLHN